jgi:hypothetical protein
MVKHHISSAQVQFHPHSFADPDGRLFSLDGGLYRAISYEKTPFFSRLFEDGTIPELVNRGLLVGSEPADLVLDGYGMVLRHASVPFVSYPNEWCPGMLKDAALTYLDLLKELIQKNLTLKDTHPWNLLFVGTRPVYVDLTSITTLKPHSSCPDENKFCRYYLHPLILMSQGHERIARYLLPDYDGIRPTEFSLLTGRANSPPRLATRFKSGLKRRVPERCRKPLRDIVSFIQSLVRKPSGANAHLENLARVRRQVEAVRLPPVPSGPDNLEPETQRRLLEIVSQLAPASILIIGTKTLWYSNLAARFGSRVVVFDKDSAYVEQLYRASHDRNLEILPLVMDFTDPTPSRGLSNHVSIAAADRFQCDLVVAIGLLNPLIKERHLRFDQVADGLIQFSKRWLILDYIPEESRAMSTRSPGQIREDLTRALLKRFRNVTMLKPASETHTLLLCEK